MSTRAELLERLSRVFSAELASVLTTVLWGHRRAAVRATPGSVAAVGAVPSARSHVGGAPLVPSASHGWERPPPFGGIPLDFCLQLDLDDFPSAVLRDNPLPPGGLLSVWVAPTPDGAMGPPQDVGAAWVGHCARSVDVAPLSTGDSGRPYAPLHLSQVPTFPGITDQALHAILREATEVEESSLEGMALDVAAVLDELIWIPGSDSQLGVLVGGHPYSYDGSLSLLCQDLVELGELRRYDAISPAEFSREHARARDLDWRPVVQLDPLPGWEWDETGRLILMAPESGWNDHPYEPCIPWMAQ